MIITIDDCYKNTIQTLIRENIDIPLVLGVPIGLLGKNLGKYPIADEDDIKELIRTLNNIEIASHGYKHRIIVASKYSTKFLLSKHRKFISLSKFPDRLDLLLRFIHTFHVNILKNKNKANTCIRYINSLLEVAASKYLIERRFGRKVVTFIYPGGYYDETLLMNVSKLYTFARTTNPGINMLNYILKSRMLRFLIKSYTISRFTNFKVLEKFYEKVSKKKNILIVETYHMIIDRKVDYIYSTKLSIFKSHIKNLTKKLNFNIVTFEDLCSS